MTFHPGQIQHFEQLFASKQSLIRNFPGCLHLELWQNQHDPCIFFTYSKWTDETALNAYRNSHFFEETWQLTKQLFAGKAEAWTIKVREIVNGARTGQDASADQTQF